MLIEMIRTLRTLSATVAARKGSMKDAKEMIAARVESLDLDGNAKAMIGNVMTSRTRYQFVTFTDTAADYLDGVQQAQHAEKVAANKPAHDKAEAQRIAQENARRELEEKQRKEREQLEKTQALESSLPMPPRHIVYSGIGDMACYQVEGIRAAIDLVKMFPVIVPMVKARDGFMRISPAEMLSDSLKRGIVEGKMYSACFDIEGGIDRHIDGANVALDFWTRIDGRLLHINISIKGPDYIGHYNKFMPEQSIQRGYNNKIISLAWKPNKYALTLGECITWASGDNGPVKKSFHQDYLISADHWEEMPVTEFWELFDRLEALIALVEGPEIKPEIVENAEYERLRFKDEYPLYSDSTGCPNQVYTGGIIKYKCACDKPNECPGVNNVRRVFGKE